MPTEHIVDRWKGGVEKPNGECSLCHAPVLYNPEPGADLFIICTDCLLARSTLPPFEPIEVHGYPGHCAECFVTYRYPGYGSKLPKPWFGG